MQYIVIAAAMVLAGHMLNNQLYHCRNTQITIAIFCNIHTLDTSIVYVFMNECGNAIKTLPLLSSFYFKH